MIFSAPRLFIDDAFTGPGSVVVEAGVITAILPGADMADVSLSHGFLAPGLIDLHNNGAFGVDCATAAGSDWQTYLDGLAAHGVTGVLPTIITAPIPDLLAAAQNIAAAMAMHGQIIGLHLEGPFLNIARRGAHRAEWLQHPTAAAVAALIANPVLTQVLKIVTLAPELPGALAAIKEFAALGAKVSLGHTDATAAQMNEAAAAGATLVTHLFNAQSALHHRAPGAPGAAITNPLLHPCLIADGVHVDPVILNLAFAGCKRAIAVTDSILLAGKPEGSSASFGGAAVRLEKGIARRQDGTIAGAAITLDEGVRRLIGAGVAPEIAFAAATSRPAAALGLADRGRIAVGMRADLVWWDDAFQVQKTWLAGITRPVQTEWRGTEYARPELHDLETRATLGIVEIFLRKEQAAFAALAGAAPALAELADAVVEKLRAGGRLFYAGAGTSGRLALLDAIECGPTFGIPKNLIIPLLAGGDGAFIDAVEGAEDDAQAAIAALAAQSFGAADALVGIAASGATPFTLAAMAYAGAQGGFTGAIVNNPATKIAAAARIAVVINSGPEVIAGSTRLSAGTMQKIALNTLSSTVMIRLGKTFGPYMVDLRASNAKLRSRAISMTARIAGAEAAAAEAALGEAGFHVKTAVVMLRRNLSAAQAVRKLGQAGGSLRLALHQ